MRPIGIPILIIGILCIALCVYGMALPASWTTMLNAGFEFSRRFTGIQGGLGATFSDRHLSDNLKVGQWINFTYMLANYSDPSAGYTVHITLEGQINSLSDPTYSLSFKQTVIETDQTGYGSEIGNVQMVTNTIATIVGRDLKTGDVICQPGGGWGDLAFTSQVTATVAGSQRIINRVDKSITGSGVSGTLKCDYDKSTGILVELYQKIWIVANPAAYLEMDMLLVGTDSFTGGTGNGNFLDPLIVMINDLLSNDSFTMILGIGGGGMILVGVLLLRSKKSAQPQRPTYTRPYFPPQY